MKNNNWKLSYVITLVILGLLISLGVSADDGGPVGKRHYTQVNIWYERPMKILDTNYHKGAIIPVGTKVTILKTSGKAIVFTDKHGVKYRIIHKARHNKVAVPVTLERMFSRKNVMAKGGKFHRFTKEEQNNIRAGVVSVGMSREAVLMAYGYPPTIRTPSIKMGTWTYWRNRWVTEIVQFANGKVVHHR